MRAVRKMIKHPKTEKRLTRVFVVGKGWFGWNSAYRVYNASASENYNQLQDSDLKDIDFSKSEK